ncbi:restriction endonuclease subunit S [Mycolicibacter sinensis]|uniref:Type I restriction modification DNA specificity domain-containing protein n=1 Tax=Mycolicibacter sinensis (strain JDM601) TaxID=875328 RepID=A0A1A2E734_MYCSD|nr:restriction endonuclease subunit S [Mycolicibacter sinensis]OBF98892.1 hypothetical protein A5772_13680 [Mycolicibacter sinensis]OBG00927.1 hypothetical protein A5771_17835 [Mycolicibacter sinensis]
MNWPAYPRYKSSGVEWLGDVPGAWAVDRLKQSVSWSQNGVWGDEPDGGPDDIRCVRVADFDRAHLRVQDRDITYRKVGGSDRRGRVLEPGSLILEKSGGGEKSPVGFVVLYDKRDPAVCSNFVAKVTLRRGMEPRYWVYVHHSLYQSRLTQRSIKQTSGIQNLDQQSYFNERVCFPPEDQQTAIADFLDHETAKIDALIAKQEQLIATLREDRTATITHAVTKGLDPDVEMKDSGVAWIGKIPHHWVLCKVKHGFSVVLGKMYQGERRSSDDELLPHLKAGSLTATCELDLDDPMPCWFSRDEQKKLSVRRNDLLVVEGGATYGRCVVVEEDLPGWGFQKSLNRVRARNADSIRFLAYLIQTATDIGHVSILCGKATIPHFTAEKLEALEWPRPALEEQLNIVGFLDERCGRIEALINKANEVIETLREYRSALITDAVTGKIDVRGAA